MSTHCTKVLQLSWNFHIATLKIKTYLVRRTRHLNSVKPFSAFLTTLVALIFHNTRSRFRNFGAAVSQHPIQGGKVISAFIHGLIPDEINSLLDRLCALPQLCESHSFIPSILLDFRLNIVTQNSTLALEKVQDIERETGLDPQWNFNARETPSRDIDLLQLNYDQITLNLTALSARLSHYVFICNVHLEMPALLDKINAQTVAAASSPEHKESLKRCELQLRMRNAQSRAYLKGTQAKVEQLLIRVQAQRDTVRLMPRCGTAVDELSSFSASLLNETVA